MVNLNWTLIETVINADTANNYKLQSTNKTSSREWMAGALALFRHWTMMLSR